MITRLANRCNVDIGSSNIIARYLMCSPLRARHLTSTLKYMFDIDTCDAEHRASSDGRATVISLSLRDAASLTLSLVSSCLKTKHIVVVGAGGVSDIGYGGPDY